jgi:Na+/proline symporter
MLGLYFLAVFARRVQHRAALLGFVTGTGVLSWIAMETSLYWPWYAAVGSVTTFICGLLFSIVYPESQKHQEHPSS